MLLCSSFRLSGIQMEQVRALENWIGIGQHDSVRIHGAISRPARDPKLPPNFKTLKP